MHIYHRQVSIGSGDSISKIAGKVRPSSRVLDVGTGTGALGKFLNTELACQLDGINNNQVEAEIARLHYRKLLVADLDHVKLSRVFEGHQYDYIVFADVLEHLRAPQEVLNDARQLLAPEGKILISLPNIGYAGVVANLIAGEFTYTDEGILDRTHIQFFTRSSLTAFLEQCELSPIAWDDVIKPLQETEFRNRLPDSFPPALARSVLRHPDALVYQFVVEAGPSTTVMQVATPAPLSLPEYTYSVQVYWSGSTQSFCEENSSRTLAVLGATRQIVRLSILGGDGQKLRLDPADRPGSLRLCDIRLVDTSGQVIWQWNRRADSLIPSTDVLVLQNGFGDEGVTLVISGEDPSLLITPDWRGHALGELFMECTLSWPSSNDTLALTQVFHDWSVNEKQQLQNRIEELQARVNVLDAQLESSQRTSATLDTSLAEAQHFVREREQQIVLAMEIQAKQTKHISTLETELTQIKLSRSWRYTSIFRKH